MAKNYVRRYLDELFTDNGPVRVSELNQNQVIVLRGMEIKVKDIPHNRVKFECGHISTGIAINEGDMIYCEQCSQEQKVVFSRAQH